MNSCEVAGLPDTFEYRFDRDGYAGPFDLCSETEARKKLNAVRAKLLRSDGSIYNQDGATAGVTNLANYDRHLDIPLLWNIVHDPAIVDLVKQIIGPDILCWRTEFFPKYPGDEGTDWHQASNFSNVAGDKKPQIEWPDGSDFGGTLTVWVGLTDATLANGCLQIIPGTHRKMNYDELKELTYDPSSINSIEKDGIRRGFFGYDYRQLQIDPTWRPEEDQAQSLIMKAGQFVIFWSTLMHASHPHLGETQDMRLGFSVRYVPTSVRVYPYSKKLQEFGGSVDLGQHGSVLVSGKDSYGHNKLFEPTWTS